MKLLNKVCVVTGAASGIGQEIAIAFAREGAKVAIADLNRAAALATAGALAEQGHTAMAVAMDVTSEEQVKAAVDLAVSAFGGLHGVVGRALSTLHRAEIGQTERHVLDEDVEVVVALAVG